MNKKEIRRISQLNIRRITLKKLDKTEIGELLSERLSVDELHEKMKYSLQNKGIVYAFYHKKNMVSYYIFDRILKPSEEVEDGDFESQSVSESIGKTLEENYEKRQKDIYYLMENYIVQEYAEFEQEMDKTIKAEMCEMALFKDCAYVEWRRSKLKRAKIPAFSGKGFLIGWGIGIFFGIVVIDNIALGISLGICFSFFFSILLFR